MKVTLSREEKVVISWIVGIILVLLIVSNILLWRAQKEQTKKGGKEK